MLSSNHERCLFPDLLYYSSFLSLPKVAYWPAVRLLAQNSRLEFGVGRDSVRNERELEESKSRRVRTFLRI